MTKAADVHLTRNLAMEWGPVNIRLNCIAPGLIKTDLARALHEDPVLSGKYNGGRCAARASPTTSAVWRCFDQPARAVCDRSNHRGGRRVVDLLRLVNDLLIEYFGLLLKVLTINICIPQHEEMLCSD